MRRWVQRRWLRRLLLGAVGLLLLVLAVFAWASLSTERSTIARALVWMESDVGDQRRFPVRRVPAGADASPLPVGAATDLPVGPDDEDRGGAVLDELLDETGTLAFLVVHKDRLVYERYFGGSDRRTLETSFSVAKSFVSALVGIAIDEGVIGGVEDPVTDYLPELAARDPRFREITLRDLLTMSSGIRYRESDLPWPWSDDTYTYYGVNLREAALAQTRVERPPRQAWHYNNNHHPLLLGLVLERATGMSVSDYQAVAAAGSPKRCHLESRLRAIGVRETGERPQRHGRRLRGSPGVTCAA